LGKGKSQARRKKDFQDVRKGSFRTKKVTNTTREAEGLTQIRRGEEPRGTEMKSCVRGLKGENGFKISSSGLCTKEEITQQGRRV